jgi:hypothetical protein
MKIQNEISNSIEPGQIALPVIRVVVIKLTQTQKLCIYYPGQ